MTANSTDIRFECKQCGQRLVVEATAAGLAFTCPNCQSELTVPIVAASREITAPREPAERPGKGKRRKASPAARTGADLGESDLRMAELEGELAAASAEIARLQHELKEAVDEREHLNASVTHTQAELKAFQAERQQSKTDLANVRQRLATVESQLSNRELELAEARDALAELKERADGAEAALGGEQQQNRMATGELERSRAALADSEARLAAAESSVEQLTATTDELTCELSEARAHLSLAGEIGKRLELAEEELQETHKKFLRTDEENRALVAKIEQARTESDALRNDLKATETGAELLDLRARIDAAETGRTQMAAGLATVEGECKTLREAGEKLREELGNAQRQNEEFREKLEAAAESQVSKDNEVLRGIIARQNSELAQHFREIHRFKRERFGLRIVYILFGLGILAVIALALKVLPPVLHF